MQIGEYTLISPLATAGSGNARWCVAEKDGKQYFLKQFLAPVQPVQTTKPPTDQVLLRRQKCAAFETRKIRLYDTLKQIPGHCVVQIDDFFVYHGHYYSASAYLGASFQTLDTYKPTQPAARLKLLLSLCKCLQLLHAHGIVHADLKPEHIIVETHHSDVSVRLIDFDAGFLEAEPPNKQNGMEVDPAYMSPEAYWLITGRKTALNRKLDTFTLGILFHQYLTGNLPGFPKEKFTYLYAALLGGGAITLSRKLTDPQQTLIRKMLRKNPRLRPSDAAICGKIKEMLG